jgi:hypothetical protein
MLITNNILYKVLIVALALWGLASCASNEIPDVVKPPVTIPNEELIPIKVPVTRTPPNVTTDPETYINSVRMIVIRNGFVSSNTALVTINQPSITIADSVPVGTVDFFLIANEKSTWNLGDPSWQKGTAHTTAELKNKILSFTNYPDTLPTAKTNPIPMARIYENLQINANGTAQYGSLMMDSLDVDYDKYWGLKRLYAKLTFNLAVVFANLVGHDPIKLDSISVKNMPSQSYLGEFIPFTLATFFNGDTLNRTASPNSYTPMPGNIGFNASFTTYLPEHIVSLKDNYTYISMNVNLAGSSAVGTKREYKIVIGDGIQGKDNATMLATAGNYLSDYNIRRNTHYTFNATLLSYEHSSDQELILRPTVLDWDASLAPDTFDYDAQYLIVNPTTIHMIGSPYQGVIDVYTDYKKGWNISHTQTGGATFSYDGPSDNRPNGQLRFRVTGGFGSVTIKITTGKDRKLEKYVMLSY